MPTTDAQKALATIKVPQRGLAKYVEPVLTYQIQARRVRMRNAIIYSEWLKAEDKETAVDLLQERWGFGQRGAVLRIIEDAKAGVIPAMAANVQVLRRAKIEEVLRDYESWRAEIDHQLRKLRSLRRGGETFTEVEVIEDTAGKLGATTKTKKVRVDAEIRRLEAEIAKSHTPEAASLADYGVREHERTDSTADIAARANAVFASEFMRQAHTDKEIPVDAEVVEG